jgi:hypothetical protein
VATVDDRPIPVFGRKALIKNKQATVVRASSPAIRAVEARDGRSRRGLTKPRLRTGVVAARRRLRASGRALTPQTGVSEAQRGCRRREVAFLTLRKGVAVAKWRS